MQDLEPSTGMQQQVILSSCHQNWPASVAVSLRTVPCQNVGLRHHKAPTRGLFNGALTRYNKEIRKTKWLFWRNYCQGIKDVLDGTRLMRIMASLPNRVESIRYMQSRKEILRNVESSFSSV